MIGRVHREPPQELLDHRSDPDARSVLDDFRLSNGERVTRLGVALWMVSRADAVAAADAADDADDDADDDDDDADDDDADADADDADADDDDADADADDDDADADALKSSRNRLEQLLGELNLEEGLKIIALPGRYGYSAVFICWLKRVAGDEFQMVPGYRFVYRTSSERNGLSELAAKGPGKNYKLKTASEVAEPVHRLVMRRVLNANEKAWAEACPKPKDWTVAS